MIFVDFRIGQRVVGRKGYATVTGVGAQRGERVVYLLWDSPKSDEAPRRDTVRARDVVPLSAAHG